MVEKGKKYLHERYGVIEILDIAEKTDTNTFCKIMYVGLNDQKWITYAFEYSNKLGNILSEV